MLNSAKGLRRCKIAAVDGRIGRVRDIHFDDERCERRQDRPGRRFPARPEYLDGVLPRGGYACVDPWQARARRTGLDRASQLTERSVAVALNQRTIRNSPEFTDIAALTEHDEDALYAYYASSTSPHEQLRGPLRSANVTRPDR